ncbi:MAG TPA: aminotransferase class III-fold pyridoxal phosphate-dependent enzyme [Gemmatimonadales bacterium]|jgi:glutamate-1-semialdehyde aminotransferase|nr:aminotransferase class III-fold pyridoxal phosphate-dependent enzyme [Gemmatimonadales bacterium]
MRVSGFTSTGSKRPDALFGGESAGLPLRMTQSAGARVWDDERREYLDLIMGLGAVALGYGHPDVIAAAVDAVERGGIGPLAPVEEERLGEQLAAMIPALEEIRFLKSGAEAVAAAVRLARAFTGRDRVLGCGYHGWLDWCSTGIGVPEAVSALYDALPFNDPNRTSALIRQAGDRLACVVIEPVIEAAPDPEWLRVIREETRRCGAVLIFDEIKTAFRVSLGGAAARWGGEPDLIILGKAMANGFPLAAVGGRAEIMREVRNTWISSTMATEFVSFAAAAATLDVARQVNLPDHLATTGGLLYAGFERLAQARPDRVTSVGGIPEMCHLRFSSDAVSQAVAEGCARRGLLFKRNAYNFVSLAHTAIDIAEALATLDTVLRELP